MKRGSAAPRRALRCGGFLGLASIFISPFLLLLFLYCSIPAMWHGTRDPRTDMADTSRREVEKLSNKAISALQLHNSQNLAAALSPKSGKSSHMVSKPTLPNDHEGREDGDLAPASRGSPHHGEESSSNPWEELSV